MIIFYDMLRNFVFNLEMLRSSTMNISVFTYIVMSKRGDGVWHNQADRHHPPLNTTQSVNCFFFILFAILIKPSAKPQTLLINTHWKKREDGGEEE